MVDHLRVEVRRSPVHGQGVYARCRFRKGAYIGTFEGTETKQDGMHVLWVTDEAGREVGVRGQNLFRFLNHAQDPNAEFWGFDLYAIRNIQPGSEIMIDYGLEWA